MLVSGGPVPLWRGVSCPTPAGSLMFVSTSARPASTSATEMALVGAEKVSGVLLGVLWGPGTVLTGGSFKAVIVSVSVSELLSGLGSVTPAGAATVAVLESVPVAEAEMEAVAV